MENKDKYVAYVGCYTRETVAGIHVCDVDMATGELTEIEQIRLDNPSHMCISHNGKHLYSCTDLGVAHLTIDEDGGLKWRKTKWTGGIRGCYISIDKEDKYLFVGGYYDGRVTVMSLREDGSLGEVVEGIFHKGVGNNVTRRANQPHVNCVILTPEEKFLCAVDNGLDCVKVYHFDHMFGKLHLVDMIHLPLKSAPRHMIFSQDGKYAYLICEQNNAIFTFSYDGSGRIPKFEQLQMIEPIKGHEDDSAGSDIVISPDGKYLLTSHAGINQVSVFEIDPDTGLLHLLFHNAINGEYPKTLAYLPDGKHFLTLNNSTGSIGFYGFAPDMSYFLNSAKKVLLKSPNCICFHKVEE